jgi:quercetin dioxygenase-like cupin family protein
MASKKDETGSLAEKVEAMRKAQTMDLETLAQKTGYDVEFLKKLEAGEVSPPVGALIQISRALAVDSAELLSEDRKQERRKSFRRRTKAYSYKNLTPEAEDKHLWAYLVSLDPKKEHERVDYKHEGEEFVYVLEGKVELQVGGEVNILKKGSSFHFNSGMAHTLRNLSTKKSKMLVVVYTP